MAEPSARRQPVDGPAAPTSASQPMAPAETAVGRGALPRVARRAAPQSRPEPNITAAWAVVGPVLGLFVSAPILTLAWVWLLAIASSALATAFGLAGPVSARADPAALPREIALEDERTGVGNAYALSGPGAALLARTLADGRPLALLVMDLDGFAALDRRYGSAAADRLLLAFARLAHDYLPPASLVCRLAGDAFAALVPGADPPRARAVADELRSLFAHLRLQEGGAPLQATVSVGIAQARPGQATRADLRGPATRCLAVAKDTGRDRVVHEADLSRDGRRSAA